MKKYLVLLLFIVAISGCKKVQTDYSETDRNIILNYIASHNLTNVKSTVSGLYYVIEKPGTTSHPNINSTVTIDYTGRLANDTIFETTDGANPETIALSSVIAGWQIGIPLFGRTGKGLLLIPSALGYGSQEKLGIPKNSVLIFEINLLDFH